MKTLSCAATQWTSWIGAVLALLLALPAASHIAAQNGLVPTVAWALHSAGNHTSRAAPVTYDGGTLADDSRPQFAYHDLYTVGALEKPPQEVFGNPLAVSIGADGTLYVADGSAGEVRVFSSHGRWLRTFGHRGKGPGEFLSVSSLQLSTDEDSLFLYDPTNNRVTVFSTAGRRLRDFTPDIAAAAPLKMWRHSSGVFLFVGPVTGRSGLVQIVDSSGRFLRSIAPILKITDPHYDKGPARDQLSQGYVRELPGGDILVSLMSPYRIARIGLDGTQRWILTDDILPPPWKGYIDFSSGIFRVRPYPIVTGVFALNSEVMMVTYYDVEKTEGGYDLRSLVDGTLLARTRDTAWATLSALLTTSSSGGLAVRGRANPFPRFTAARWRLLNSP